jgi:hypothetical protein
MARKMMMTMTISTITFLPKVQMDVRHNGVRLDRLVGFSPVGLPSVLYGPFVHDCEPITIFEIGGNSQDKMKKNGRPVTRVIEKKNSMTCVLTTAKNIGV